MQYISIMYSYTVCAQYALNCIEYTLHDTEYILHCTKYTLHNALMQTISIMMRSSRDEEFRRWGVHRMGSSRYREFMIWGVQEFTLHSTEYTHHDT